MKNFFRIVIVSFCFFYVANSFAELEYKHKAAEYYSKGEYQSAVDEYLKGYNTYSNEGAKDRVFYAYKLGSLYSEIGEYEASEKYLNIAHDLNEKLYGKDSVEFLQTLNELGLLARKNGEYFEAVKILKQAMKMQVDLAGKENQQYAYILNNLARVYQLTSEFKKALKLYSEAVDINTKVLGKNHEFTANTINNLGLLYRKMGDYEKAMLSFDEAIEIRKNTIGENHTDYAESLNTKAMLYRKMGDYERAEPLFLQALEIRKRNIGRIHPDYASVLNNLAKLYEKTDKLEKALSLYEESVEINLKIFGEKHPYTANSYNNLAKVKSRLGDLEEALILNGKALDIRKDILGENHPDYAESLNTQGLLLDQKGDYNTAIKYLQEALKIRKKTLGKSHPDYASVLNNISFVLGKNKQYEEAIDSFVELHKSQNLFIEKTLLGLDEEQKIKYINSINNSYEGALSLILEMQKNNKAIIKKAFNLTLMRKGIIFDAEVKARRKEEFEIGEISMEQINRNLPANSSLVEIVQIKPFNWSGKNDDIKEIYAAFILNDKGDLNFIRIGKKEFINDQVSKALKIIKRIGTDANKQIELAKNLYEILWKPIEGFLPSKNEKIFISPDGLLNVVPYNALTSKDNKFLIENKELTYLTSARNIISTPSVIKPELELFLVANPKFDLSVNDLQNISNNKLRSADSYLKFSPLPGTKSEAEIILELFSGKKEVLLEEYATELAVKSVFRPKVMHLATHGFFLNGDIPNNITGTRGASPIGLDTEQIIKNFQTSTINTTSAYLKPLLNSGLAFSGANNANDNKVKENDGILTALEVSDMDLLGTHLVTLSACETGLGSINSGEGVFGLRRSFALAGAENLLMSLWAVSDEITSVQMGIFYENYTKGISISASLRDSQLKVINKLRQNKGIAAPADWAAFFTQKN